MAAIPAVVYTVSVNGSMYLISSQLVAGGCRPETHDMDGQAPLHKAVLYGQQDSVQGLVLAGADLNIRDGNSNTAVHVSTLPARGIASFPGSKTPT